MRFEAKLRVVKMTVERWPHHHFVFTQRLVGLLVKSIYFRNQWHFKNGKKHFLCCNL